MRNIWNFFKDLIDALFTDATEVARKLSLQGNPGGNRTRPEVYLRSLKRLLLGTSLFPIPILLLGIFVESNWMIALVGLFWCLCTFALILVAAPLGILLEALLGKTDGSGERYVKLTIGIFLTELIFTLFVAVIPVRNNLGALPLVIICSVILALFGTTKAAKTGFTKSTIAKLVGIILVVLTISFFFPNTFSAMKNVRGRIDNLVASALNKKEGPPNGKVSPPPEEWVIYWKKPLNEKGVTDERSKKIIAQVAESTPKMLRLRWGEKGELQVNQIEDGALWEGWGQSNDTPHKVTIKEFEWVSSIWGEGWSVGKSGDQAKIVLRKEKI